MRTTTSEKKIVAQRIGSLIQEWRFSYKLTQIEAAKILEISQSTLSKIESLGVLPSADIWYKMAIRTGMPFDAPFKETLGGRMKYDPSEKKLNTLSK